MEKLKVTLQLLIISSMACFGVHATLVDVSSNPAGQADCVSTVEIQGRESFADDANPRMIHSVYKAQILENLACHSASPGDFIYFAAPGGVIGEIGVRVNGIDIEVGDEATIHLSNSSTTLSIPYLIKVDSLKRAQTNGSQLFACSRTSSSTPSLYWPNRVVTMHPAGSSDSRVSETDLIDSITWSANQWSEKSCSDFRFLVGAPVSQRWVGFDWGKDAENYNIVTLRRTSNADFYSEWSYAANLLALTSVTYISRSGEVVDADIELNGTNFHFTNCDSPGCTTVHDLKNTLTHEFGHVLGLDHPSPQVEGSIETTMFAQSASGDIKKRTLAQGDIDGLCFIYPAGAEARECFGVARKPDPGLKIASGAGGCSQSNSTSSSIPFLFFVFLIGVSRFRAFTVSDNTSIPN